MPFERITIPAVSDCSRKPCQVEWTNAFHFDPTTKGGQCVHFSAISAGKIFIAFAQSPKNRDQWYYVRIGLEEVAIYKVKRLSLLKD